MADTVGESVDNKTRLDVIRQQEELIKEEAEEKEREVRVWRRMILTKGLTERSIPPGYMVCTTCTCT